MKLTTLREQATTVENNVQTSEEVAKTYEQKNKVRMKIFCEFLIICFFSLVAGCLRTYSAFLLARLKVSPNRFLNVALQHPEGKPRFQGPKYPENYLWLVVTLRENSTNQSLYSYVISMNWFLLARNFKRLSSEGWLSVWGEMSVHLFYRSVLSLF